MRFCSQYKTEADLNSCLSRESELRYSSCVQGQDVTNENSSKEISCHNCTECNDMTPMLESPCWGPDSSEDCCISLDACYVNVNGICSCLSFPYYYYSKMSNLLRIRDKHDSYKVKLRLILSDPWQQKWDFWHFDVYRHIKKCFRGHERLSYLWNKRRMCPKWRLWHVRRRGLL